MDKLRNKTREITYTNIPTQTEKTGPEEPEWVTKLEPWGTGKEIRQLDHSRKKELKFSKKSSGATKN